MTKDSLRLFFSSLSKESLIALALLLSLANQIKFISKIGPSEIIFFFFVVYAFFTYVFNQKNNLIVKLPSYKSVEPIFHFLIYFFLLSSIGTIFNETQIIISGEYVYHNIFAFLYLIAIFTTIAFFTEINLEKVSNNFFVMFVCLLIIFTIISIMTRNLFDIDLFFRLSDRLTLFTRSPNHLGQFLAPVPFFILYYAARANKLTIRLTYLFSAVFIFYIGILTQSKAVYLAWFISTFTIFMYLLLNKKIIFNLFLLGVFIFLFLIPELYNKVFITIGKLDSNFINSMYFENQKPIRSLLYDIYVRAMLLFNSFPLDDIKTIFGQGFGGTTYIYEITEAREAHNNFFDVLLFSGYLGLFLYVILNLKILSLIIKSKNIYLFLAFFSITLVSLFHLSFRQPIFWFYLAFIINQARLSLVKNE